MAKQAHREVELETTGRIVLAEALQPQGGIVAEAEAVVEAGVEAGPPTPNGKDKLAALYLELQSAQLAEQAALAAIAKAKSLREAVASQERDILSSLCEAVAGAIVVHLANNPDVAQALESGGNGQAYNYILAHRPEGKSWAEVVVTISRSTPTSYKTGGIAKGTGGGTRGLRVKVDGREYNSAAEACRQLELSINGNSAVRVLTDWAKKQGKSLEALG